jgi:hypothetical protein
MFSMNRYKRILLFSFILGARLTNGQADNCACCAYSSLKFKNDYDGIFAPSIIEKNKLRTLIIYTQVIDDSLHRRLDKYREMKFQFSDNGKVVSRTEYNRNGKPHSIYEFERDRAGKIVKESFYYLDSLERKVTHGSFSVADITDFSYDSKGQLVKSKKRDLKGNVITDNQTNFSKYEYDDKGRKVKETTQYYYGENGPETSIYITSYSYNNERFESSSQTFENKRLFLKAKATYNNTWKVLTENQFDDQNIMVSQTRHFYDNLGRPTMLETKAGNLATECPDGGTYSDTYEYDGSGLLKRIAHRYDNYTCLMTFEYE